mmetsp:Transcript_9456/g.23575  ORF Transcript_9456/g.23575 Transcript_9456/m.23575 type:complete len:96 (+) Transcript_9456:693-980(+)
MHHVAERTPGTDGMWEAGCRRFAQPQCCFAEADYRMNPVNSVMLCPPRTARRTSWCYCQGPLHAEVCRLTSPFWQLFSRWCGCFEQSFTANVSID